MTRTKNARIAGFTLLLLIAAGITAIVQKLESDLSPLSAE